MRTHNTKRILNSFYRNMPRLPHQNSTVEKPKTVTINLYLYFEDRTRDLIVSVPDHCLSFYFITFHSIFILLLTLMRTPTWTFMLT